MSEFQKNPSVFDTFSYALNYTHDYRHNMIWEPTVMDTAFGRTQPYRQQQIPGPIEWTWVNKTHLLFRAGKPWYAYLQEGNEERP